MFIWIWGYSISCAFKKIFRLSFNARSSILFMCIFLPCWVHVHPVFTSSQTVPLPTYPATWMKYLFVKELGLEVELRPFHCILSCCWSANEDIFETSCSVTLNLRVIFLQCLNLLILDKTTVVFCWDNSQNCWGQLT